MSDFWSNIPTVYTNEADVELRLVLPLLHTLGYEPEDLASKYPVEFREGRVGRKPEADYVCFSGPLHNRGTSLVVVEAKSPDETLPSGKVQGESYAQNLRAPILLLTNGKSLEVWQLKATQESELVLQAEISSLATHRGEVERLLTKSAVRDYCHTFKVKTILEASMDFGRYEQAELKRTARYAQSISRTLHPLDPFANAPTTIDSDRLLAECPSGCVIVAPSGYGKTTLAFRLFRKAIEGRWRDNSVRLPFDVPVTDLEQTGLSIVAFLHRRLRAHQPGLTEGTLDDNLRKSGATVLLDGFDRASPSYQRHLRAEITNFLRDYPLIQLFVFSRGAARPALTLPVFVLKSLTDVEKWRLEGAILGEDHSIIHMMSPTLSALCDVPLLFQLSLSYWQSKQTLPDQIESLFREWLESVLKVEGVEVVSDIVREQALTLIATAASGAPVECTHVLNLFKERGLPAQILDELVSCDAARVYGRTVEVQHDALADYLRAKELAQKPEKDLIDEIRALTMPEESFFPVLLISHLPSHRLQAELWKKIVDAGPTIYFDALRYRCDVSAELSRLDEGTLSREYLTELLQGIEQPLDCFFPALREAIVEDLAAEPGSRLAVIGQVYAQTGKLTYKLEAAAGDQVERVTVAVPSGPGILRAVSLSLSRYRLDSARLVGAALLKESVLEAINTKSLKGGPMWAEERLISRCRFLAKEYDFPLLIDMPLDAIEASLLPHKDKWVLPAALSHSQRFSIQSLLDDIAVLRQSGKTGLESWWVRLGWNDHERTQSDEVIRGVLDEQYRRVQIMCAEVARNTFHNISNKMTSFAQLPARWKLTIVRRRPSGLVIYPTWLPVLDWSEAGADVEIADQAPGGHDFESTVETLRAALDALGRPSDAVSGFGGFTTHHGFTGYQWNCHFDGGTPAIHECCDLIKAEIEGLFSAMAGQDGV